MAEIKEGKNRKKRARLKLCVVFVFSFKGPSLLGRSVGRSVDDERMGWVQWIQRGRDMRNEEIERSDE